MSDFDVNEILLEFIEMIKNNINISNIYIFKYDSLKLIYTNKINSNLHHSNNIIDYILHHIEFILIDSDYNIITYLTKNITLDKSSIQLLNNNWNECKVYTNYIGIYCIFLYYNQKKYYITKHRIDNYENSIMMQIVPKIFDNIAENESVKIIHKIIVSQRLKHILCYDPEFNQINNICYDPEESQIFYSCYDELDYENNDNIKKMENNKKIFNAGYLIIYKNKKYLLPNKIYEKVSNLLPKYSNINKIYIDLYKSDNLNYVINYLSLYPSDIIKRINLSFKTISREYLNIYHMTRKKSHPEIYEKLNEINKKILYDFHTIFITTRQNEYIINTDRNDYYDKKSLSIDTVYKYFKKIDIDILEKIYLDRNELIKSIKEVFNNDDFKIFFEDCINTKTISYLLNKNY
jgi:hypothetical protein